MMDLIAIETQGYVFALVSAAGGASNIAASHLTPPTILSVFQVNRNMILIESHTLVSGLLAFMLAMKVAADGDEERPHLRKQLAFGGKRQKSDDIVCNGDGQHLIQVKQCIGLPLKAIKKGASNKLEPIDDLIYRIYILNLLQIASVLLARLLGVLQWANLQLMKALYELFEFWVSLQEHHEGALIFQYLNKDISLGLSSLDLAVNILPISQVDLLIDDSRSF